MPFPLNRTIGIFQHRHLPLLLCWLSAPPPRPSLHHRHRNRHPCAPREHRSECALITAQRDFEQPLLPPALQVVDQIRRADEAADEIRLLPLVQLWNGSEALLQKRGKRAKEDPPSNRAPKRAGQAAQHGDEGDDNDMRRCGCEEEDVRERVVQNGAGAEAVGEACW